MRSHWIISCVLALTIIIFPSQIFASVVINEVLPDPSGVDSENEWLELFNTESVSVSLDGYVIKDRNEKTITLNGNIDKWRVIYPKDFPKSGSFALTNTGEVALKIFTSIDSIDPIDTFVYNGSSTDKSWGRIPDGENIYGEKLDPTKGSANQPPATPTPSPSPTPTPTPKPATPKPTTTTKSTTSTTTSKSPTSPPTIAVSSVPISIDEVEDEDDNILASQSATVSHMIFSSPAEATKADVLGITSTPVIKGSLFIIAGGLALLAASVATGYRIRKTGNM